MLELPTVKTLSPITDELIISPVDGQLVSLNMKVDSLNIDMSVTKEALTIASI